jgi:nucleoside-diphosphate-sugar epimerase
VREGILLTGATGALGSMLLQRLCREGHDVICLVRGNDLIEACARIETIVGDRENVTVFRGDITQPRCGLTDIDCKMLAGRVNRILNCAGSISFHDKNAAQLTNVAGVRHVLELMEILGVKRVLHVSTAYVVGDGSYLSEEGLSNGQRWRNPYEESKFVGETMIRAWAQQSSKRSYAIFRPSIFIGGEDGTTTSFDGYYRYLEPVYRAAENFRKRRSESLPPDVIVDGNGMVRAPLALIAADKCVNYIQVDWVADMIVAAVDLPARNETYNLVNHNPPRTLDCMAWSLDHLKIGGVVVCETQAAKDIVVKAQTRLVNRMQRRIDVIHDAYAPYCTTEPEFQMEAASRNLGAKFRLPPLIDQRFLMRTLDYALENNWGASKKVKVGEPV